MMAEAHRRTNSSPTRLRWPIGPVHMPVGFVGACRTRSCYPLILPCTVAPFSSAPELRRPPKSSPASSVPPSTSASRSSSMCSCCLVATACALRSLERELQPHARAIPNSGRRPSGRRRRYRPSPVKQRAPQDAREPGLRVGALRRAIGAGATIPQPSAAFRPRQQLNAGGVDLPDLGFDPPGSLTRGPCRPGG